jgi:hypothetical protein
MSILPTNYVAAGESDPAAPSAPSRYLKPSSIKPGQSLTLRLCGTYGSGHVIAGYSYFNMEGRPRRFPTFPKDYLEDIGLTFEAKKNGTGEKGTPIYFLSWACLVKGDQEFKIIDITQKKVREQIEAVLAMEDYTIEDGAPANFFLTITRQGEGKDTSYTVIPTLKVASAEDRKRWHAASESLWLPALFENGDPFGGKPSGASADETPTTPLTHRDKLGADQELTAAGW